MAKQGTKGWMSYLTARREGRVKEAAVWRGLEALEGRLLLSGDGVLGGGSGEEPLDFDGLRDGFHCLTPRDLLPADLDGNGVVNIRDLSILATHFGDTGTHEQGDVNGDDAINITDLSLLATQFGQNIDDIDNPTDPVQIGLLLPAVQKVREAAARGSAALEDLLLKGSGEEILIGLLLPAVQKVREAAAVSDEALTDLLGPTDPDGMLIGLLLPAVQKVREAAAQGHSALEQALREFDLGPETQAMLLPAVQKVREAAARSGHTAGELLHCADPQGTLMGLLVPAVQKVREAAGQRVPPTEDVKAFDHDSGEITTVPPFSYDPAHPDLSNRAYGDFNGDGAPDLVVAGREGQAPHVKVFDGRTGQVIHSFFAYQAAFTGGVRVATGDVNGDGVVDIITGAGPGAGPHVKVFDGSTGAELRSFFAYAAAFTGGVNVAAGDVNGDGFADIITGAGAGAGPHVKVFSGATNQELHSFFAYPATFTGGVRVAAGDVNGDGRADVITSAAMPSTDDLLDQIDGAQHIIAVLIGLLALD